MTTNRQFSLALNALVELKQEVAAPLSTPLPAAPPLSRVLLEIGSLPREALFLGVAVDGLPVLLNLRDPLPGSILIVGETGSGKTTFLQTLAHGIQRIHSSEDIQFGVITAHPDEWNHLDVTAHRIGVFPVNASSVQDLLSSLVSWAHAKHTARHSILLLIDDLEAVARLDPDALQNLRWLLLRGPARKVWPVITLNAERYGQVLSWIPMFRTRIFGRIAKAAVAEALSSDQPSVLNQLEAGIQFSLRENGKWLKFWLPSR